MAKKNWINIDLNKFFADPLGPAAPIKLGNQQPKVRRKVPSQGNVKIPKMGPEIPKGTPPRASAKTTTERLNNLRDLNPAGVENPSFEPVTFQLVNKEDRLFLKVSSEERIREARKVGDRAEEARLMRLMRNTEELRKVKARPYRTPGIIESLEAKIAKDIAADPQRSLARSALENTFGLEVDPMFGLQASGKSRIYADVANQYTAERVAAGHTAMLSDMPTERFSTKFRPVSKAQRQKAKQISKQKHEEYLATNIKEHEKLFLKNLEDDIGTGMGVPNNLKVGRKMPGMLEGMEQLGLPFNDTSAATQSLEVSKRGFAFPADAETAARVANGETKILGRPTFIHTPMEVSPLGPLFDIKDYKGRMLAYREEQSILKEQRKNYRLHLDSFYGTYGQNTEMGMGIPEHGRVMFGQPDWMQGYGAINRQNTQLDIAASRHLKDQQRMILEVQAKVNAIPLNYETNAGLAGRYTSDAAQATIRSEAAQVAARTSETVTQEAARMTNRTAGIIAEDTMRAASVLHSSKLGGAAIGSMAIMGAFGIMSLKGSQFRRQKEVTGR